MLPRLRCCVFALTGHLAVAQPGHLSIGSTHTQADHRRRKQSTRALAERERAVATVSTLVPMSTAPE